MNLPNLLTLFRFAMVPIYLLVFFSDIPGRQYWAIGIILFAGLTDFLDGYIARRFKLITRMGIMLDPLADKLMMMAVFISLLISSKISILAAVAIVLREISMIIFGAVFHFRGKKTVPANVFGKLTTILFYVALFLSMFSIPYSSTFLWGVITLSYITTLIYLLQIQKINQQSIRLK